MKFMTRLREFVKAQTAKLTLFLIIMASFLFNQRIRQDFVEHPRRESSWTSFQNSHNPC